MSRTGTYWSDHNGRLNCAHGVLLHGTNCVRCERGDLPDDPPGPRNFVADAVQAAMAGQFSDGGFVPKSLRATGFGTASGPDHTAFAFQRTHAGGKSYHFTTDDLKAGYEHRRAINGDEERLEAMQAAMSAASQRLRDDLLRAAARGEGWGGPFTTDPPWGWEAPRKRAVEVITDPTDTRGVNARRVGPSA